MPINYFVAYRDQFHFYQQYIFLYFASVKTACKYKFS